MTARSEFSDVPAGKIAAIVTYLEMCSRPTLKDVEPPSGFALRRVETPEATWYRDLYRRIGAELLWFSALTLSDNELAEKIRHPELEVYALTMNGDDEGLVELDFRQHGECELGFFGLSPDMVGSGAGKFMMSHAIDRAWSRPITRFWLHTCTLDHPNALPFYIRSGFTAYARQIEIAGDPRLTGILPREAAPQVPVIEP